MPQFSELLSEKIIFLYIFIQHCLESEERPGVRRHVESLVIPHVWFQWHEWDGFLFFLCRCCFLFSSSPIIQWTTAQSWIVSSVTSTILPLKATKRFFSSSRSSDPQATRSTSASPRQQSSCLFPLLRLRGRPPVETTRLCFTPPLPNVTTDQCCIFSHFLFPRRRRILWILVASRSTPTLP